MKPPAALATGISKYSRQATKRDLLLLMRARQRAAVPLLVGSCGTSGCDRAVDSTLDIVTEIAREEGISPRIAVLYSEQDRATSAAAAPRRSARLDYPRLRSFDLDLFGASVRVTAGSRCCRPK